MEYVKFNGLIKKIQEQYNKKFDLTEFLKNELKTTETKAKILAEKINSIYDFKENYEIKIQTTEPTAPTTKITNQPQKFNIYTLEKPQKFNLYALEEPQKKINIYALDNLSGKEFEEFLKWLFQKLEYNVQLTKATSDSGVDLVLEKNKEKIAVQAKRYDRNTKVSNTVILKTHGGMAIYNCNKSIIITTSYYTKQAKEDAKKLNIELWDRNDLSAKMDQINNQTTQKKLPEFDTTLFKSLLNLEKTGEFKIENKSNGKYNILKHGIKQPLISFRTSLNNITHLSFRINNDKPIPEYGPEAKPLITSDRGSIYGPAGEYAYNKIVEYLEQFR